MAWLGGLTSPLLCGTLQKAGGTQAAMTSGWGAKQGLWSHSPKTGTGRKGMGSQPESRQVFGRDPILLPGIGLEGLDKAAPGELRPYQESGSASLKPLAKGLLAIFSWVICRGESPEMGLQEAGGTQCHPPVLSASPLLTPWMSGRCIWVHVHPAAPTYPVVLIGRHGGELGFGEDEGLEVLLGIAFAVLARVHEHHVEAGLVAVHGVEDDLGVRKGVRWVAQCKPSLTLVSPWAHAPRFW